MRARISLLLLAVIAVFLLLPTGAGAGEIVKRTYTNAKGEKVSGYVYRSGNPRGRSSSTSRHRTRTTRHYPAFRSHGYVVGGHGCRTARPAVSTTRTAITYNAACPITVGARQQRYSRGGGVTVFRKR